MLYIVCSMMQGAVILAILIVLILATLYTTHKFVYDLPRNDVEINDVILAAPHYEVDTPIAQSSPDTPAHDLDTDFTGSREVMGAAASGKVHCTKVRPHADTSVNRGDDFPMGALNLLYRDTIGIDIDAGPSQDDCEYHNEIGLVYKEPCTLDNNDVFV